MLPASIIQFWFSAQMRGAWFQSTPELDEQIRKDYELLWQAAKQGEHDSWQETAEGCLALCIVLDQFPLNMFRGQAKSFATEAKAIAIAKYAIERGLDQELEKDRLAFLYMPLMHSEDMADQDLSVKMFAAAGLEENLRFAHHHRDIIERFGRFPHRNAILGRESTAQEVDYLNSKEAFRG